MRYPEAPWSELVGFRNIVAHAYHRVDWDLVWTAATQDIPGLRKQIVAILQAEYPPDETA